MKNRFPVTLIALAFCCFFAPPSYAQAPPATEEKGRPPMMRIISPQPAQAPITPEKKALILELVGILNSNNNAETLVIQFMDQYQESGIILIKNDLREWIEEQKVSPAEKKRLEAEMETSAQRILARLRDEFPKRVKMGEILETITLEIYNKYFSEAEVKDVIAFYKSPTGQKFIKILPQISGEMLPRIGQLIETPAAELAIELLADEIKRLAGKRN